MAKHNININSDIRKAMHRPVTKSGYVLYVKQNDYKGESEGGESATLAISDPEYIKASVNNYNSPTNIRRLFITGKRVEVQYYTGPKHNKTRADVWTSKILEHNIFEVVEKIFNQGYEQQQYAIEASLGNKTAKPDRYEIKGNGIGVVSNPYVCSNIEEIYFDWTLMLSAESAPYFQSLLTDNHIMSFLQKTTTFSEVKNNDVIKFFEAFNSGGVKDIRKRFPRLKTVAMISNLDAILTHPAVKKSKLDLINDTSNNSWYASNKELIAQSNSFVLYGDLSYGLTNPNTNFTVKSQQYKFDHEILDVFVKTYKAKAENIIRKQRYGADAVEAVDNIVEQSDVEKALIELEEKLKGTGIKATTIAQYAAIGGGIPKAELGKIVKDFTKPNREKYAKALGINL